MNIIRKNIQSYLQLDRDEVAIPLRNTRSDKGIWDMGWLPRKENNSKTFVTKSNPL